MCDVGTDNGDDIGLDSLLVIEIRSSSSLSFCRSQRLRKARGLFGEVTGLNRYSWASLVPKEGSPGGVGTLYGAPATTGCHGKIEHRRIAFNISVDEEEERSWLLVKACFVSDFGRQSRSLREKDRIW